MEIVNFPDNIKSLITNDFLTTFKEKMDELGAFHKPDVPTYWNFYQQFDGTALIREVLIESCKICNTMEICDFLFELGWHDYYILEARFSEMLYENEIIDEGNWNDVYDYHNDAYDCHDDHVELLESM